MSLKTYFKPDQKRITTFFLLVTISIAIFLIFRKFPIIFFSLPPLTTISSYNILIHVITFVLFITISYLFACYITQNKNLFAGIVFHLITLAVIIVIISVGIFLIVDSYNNAFGHSCNTDSDCHYSCEGAINNKYIFLRGAIIECWKNLASYTKCVEAKCKIFRINESSDVKECEKFREDLRENCYLTIAIMKKDRNICEYIENNKSKTYCNVKTSGV